MFPMSYSESSERLSITSIYVDCRSEYLCHLTFLCDILSPFVSLTAVLSISSLFSFFPMRSTSGVPSRGSRNPVKL